MTAEETIWFLFLSLIISCLVYCECYLCWIIKTLFVSFLDFPTKISNLKNKQFSWPTLIAQEENKLDQENVYFFQCKQF